MLQPAIDVRCSLSCHERNTTHTGAETAVTAAPSPSYASYLRVWKSTQLLSFCCCSNSKWSCSIMATAWAGSDGGSSCSSAHAAGSWPLAADTYHMPPRPLHARLGPVNNHPPTRVNVIFNVGLHLPVLSRHGWYATTACHAVIDYYTTISSALPRPRARR
jgi:hypothetical protein